MKKPTNQPTNETKHAKESRQEKFLQTEIKVKGLAVRAVSERTLYDKYHIICGKNMKPDIIESSEVTCVGSSAQILGEGSTSI